MTDQELIAQFDNWIEYEVLLVTADELLPMRDHIEHLVKERDDYKDLYYAAFKDAASLNIHYAEIGYKAKTAEAKLTKAVEALRVALEGLNWAKAYLSTSGIDSDLVNNADANVYATLTDLEGKE